MKDKMYLAILSTFVVRNWRNAACVTLLTCAIEGVSGQTVMNFVGSDIESVIKAVGQYTHLTFIIDPRVKGSIKLVSEKPLSKAQAFDLLASTLRLQGYRGGMQRRFRQCRAGNRCKAAAGLVIRRCECAWGGR